MCIFKLSGQVKKDNNKTEFKSLCAKDKAVFTCNHVTDEKSPI
ncbi:MAG: hypothetical protein ACJA1A_002150 [Saprospiraceae bacterium]|jgi:hypothetical protein